MDVSFNQSVSLRRENVVSSDLIFVMEDRHKEAVINLEPTAEDRVFKLCDFLFNTQYSVIPDPVGGSDQIYRQNYALIKDAIKELVDWL